MEYWEVMVKVCPTDQDKAAFKHRFDRVFMPLLPRVQRL